MTRGHELHNVPSERQWLIRMLRVIIAMIEASRYA